MSDPNEEKPSVPSTPAAPSRAAPPPAPPPDIQPAATSRRLPLVAGIAAAIVSAVTIIAVLFWMSSRRATTSEPPPQGSPGITQGVLAAPGVPGGSAAARVAAGETPSQGVSSRGMSAEDRADALPRVGAPPPPTDIQVYWRFATGDYFASHPHVPRSKIVIPDGYSASLVRVDIENHGQEPISIIPDGFQLACQTAEVGPTNAMIPDTLKPAHVPPGGSIRGWLLFIKPWWDTGPQSMKSLLVSPAYPDAEITLSDRGRGAGRAANPQPRPLSFHGPRGASAA